MSVYRDEKLLRREQAKKDLEGASPSECNDVEETLNRVLSQEKDLNLLLTKKLITEDDLTRKLNPEDEEGLVGVRDHLMKKRLARTRQKLVTFGAAAVLGLGMFYAAVGMRQQYIGEAPHLQAYSSPNLDPIVCNAHNNDCSSMQSLPQDGYGITMLVDISGSMQDEIQSSREAALDFSSEFAGQQYRFALFHLDDFPTSCYTGPAETRNVGECHGGRYLYTGVGTFRCAGQVVPNVEAGYFSRNGIDEDCDGCVDNVYGLDGTCLTTVSPSDLINPGCELNEECDEIGPGAVCLEGMCGYL